MDTYKYTSRLLSLKVIYFILTFTTATFFAASCKKFIEVDAPITSRNYSVAYGSDNNAISVLNGLYSEMSGGSISGHGVAGLSVIPGLSSDELTVFNPTSQSTSPYTRYFQNTLNSNQNGSFWETLYQYLYIANDAIQGISKSLAISPSAKNQLIGEAKFVRAFIYFYLVNLYGPVPLATTPDYQINRQLPRSSVTDVYNLIVEDLLEAESLLNENYLDKNLKPTNERIAPNKFTATALLARTYLYQKKWEEAERYSTKVIENTNLYDTVSIGEVFLKNSKEAIWQLQPVGFNPSNTLEARLFILPSSGPDLSSFPIYLSAGLANSFGPLDLRGKRWINSVSTSTATYYFPFKYKNFGGDASVTEYSTVLRIAEQYLIRSEARSNMNKNVLALQDLNLIRHRSGQPDTSLTNTTEMINAILRERRLELFTEYGHRWMDLKRLNLINDVMKVETPNKGGVWNENWALYPIPQNELLRNINLNGTQNPGYN